MNQYKELKDSFLLLKAQINALCASNSSSNEDNYRELRRATDDFEAFLFHRFVVFEQMFSCCPVFKIFFTQFKLNPFKRE
mgnify:CR=1 FL=1